MRPAYAIAALAAALTMAAGASAAVPPPAHRPPIDHSRRPQVGKASYYARDLSGAVTASGKTEKATKMTAASKTLPLGTRAKVTNLDTGKSAKVTVTDRGPYVRHRIMDLSRKAATVLGMKHDGVATVKVQPLKEPPSKVASR